MMKKIILASVVILLLISSIACDGMSISNKRYSEISRHVLIIKESFTAKEDIGFFDDETTGLSVGGVYYGYYYSKDNVIVIPNFYSGDDLAAPHQADGGTYFGKPNNGENWCFVKQITDNWYYYELHWG